MRRFCFSGAASAPHRLRFFKPPELLGQQQICDGVFYLNICVGVGLARVGCGKLDLCSADGTFRINVPGRRPRGNALCLTRLAINDCF